jgi:hypothetical protein
LFLPENNNESADEMRNSNCGWTISERQGIASANSASAIRD